MSFSIRSPHTSKGVRSKGPHARPLAAHAAAPVAATSQDPFISQALSTLPTSTSLSEAAAPLLESSKVPSTRVEAFRFTDMRSLTAQTLAAPPAADYVAVANAVAACALPQSDGCRAVIVDGLFRPDLSDLTAVPLPVFVGEADDAPDAATSHLGAQSTERGGVFALMNSATSSGCLAVYAPEDARAAAPVHIVHVSSSASDSGVLAASAARVLLVAEPGSQIEIIEEFVGLDGGQYFGNSVAEVEVGKCAQVRHSVLETEAAGAFHVKGTFVRQQEGSAYTHVEVRLGGALSRHDLSIQQEGPSTSTTLRHFLLCNEGQLHDLHTSLTLDHPHGVADQVHKCIVAAATGRGVFDGQVSVNKLAQLTDAGQLSRNLLLVPKATVNVKPNLKIIADDVKCTHGCAVSDLSADEMFYFQSRGIDANTARRALVVSFGAEVVQQLQHKELVERVQEAVRQQLADVVA